MSRQLIAAALKLTALAERNTDHDDEWQRAILDVREAVCKANAMVQPDIAEVERLVSHFGDCAMDYAAASSDDYGRWLSIQKQEAEARTALLDAVRAIAAERDALRDAAKIVRRADGLPANPEERHLRRLLAFRVAMPCTYYDDGEAQGQQHGIAIDFMREPVADLDAKLRALNVARLECAAQRPVGEVPFPMPDRTLYGPDRTVSGHVYTAAKVRTYGDARYQQGYEAGLKAVRDYAVERWKAEVDLRPLENKHRRTLDDVWRQVISHTGGDPVALIGPCHDALAALRGEVKP